MSVFQNKQRGGRWQYDFWHQGRRFTGPCVDPETGTPVAGKKAALAVERKARDRAEVEAKAEGATGQGVTGHYTLIQAGSALVRRLVDKKRNLSHIENNRLYVSEIVGFFGPDKAFRDLTQADIDRYAVFAAAQTRKTWLGGRRSRTDEDLANPALWRDTGRPRSIRTTNNYLKCLLKLMAMAAKVRDLFTKQPEVDPAIEIELGRPPKRKPRPMTDQELYERSKVLMPWTREAAELARLFGLRKDEALGCRIRHIDRFNRRLLFAAGETKSGNEEPAYGGAEGWKLLLRLERQARKRKTEFLITWPGSRWVHVVIEGGTPKPEKWLPLKTLGNSWRKSGKRAGISDPLRFHDVRGRYITEVAKVSKVAAKDAARHQSAATTELYIGVAEDEVASAVAEASSRRPGPAVKRPKFRIVK